MKRYTLYNAKLGTCKSLTEEQMQEAIKCIEDVLSSDYHYDESLGYQLSSYDFEWLEKSKEALKKQIPKKPLDICEPVIKWGLCPVCHGELNKFGGKPNRVFESNKFCPDCGQALDWNREDNDVNE